MHPPTVLNEGTTRGTMPRTRTLTPWKTSPASKITWRGSSMIENRSAPSISRVTETATPRRERPPWYYVTPWEALMPRRKKTGDDDDTNRRVGDVVSRLRKERGWTLQYVAIEIGLSVSHVSALESGQYTFSAAIIEKLTKLF